jgi:O-antigen/teichoic acid export membrane protein
MINKSATKVRYAAESFVTTLTWLFVRVIPIFRLYLIRILSILLSFGFSILVARLLGDQIFGEYVVVMAVVGLVAVATGVGLPQLLERETAAARGNGKIERLAIVLQGIALLTIIICIIAAPAAFTFGLIGLTAGLFVITGLLASFAAAALRAVERVELSMFLDGAVKPAIALPLVPLTIWIIGPVVVAPIFALVLSAFLSSTILIWFLRRTNTNVLIQALRLSRSLRFGPKHRIISISALNFGLIQLLVNATQQAEILWLSILASPEEVAHFFAASRAGNAVAVLHGSVIAMYAPRIIRLHGAGDIQARDNEVLLATKISFFVTLLFVIVGIFASGTYLNLFGQEFSEGQTPMIIMLFGWLLISALGPVTTLMTTLGHERDVWIGIAVGLAGGGLSAYILIQSHGIVGAAVSFNVMILLSQIYILPKLRQLVGFIPICGFKL